MKTKEKAQNIKSWLKDETSQNSSETGTLTVGILLVAAGIIILLGPQIKTGFSNITQKFVAASQGDGSLIDPLNGTGSSDWAN